MSNENRPNVFNNPTAIKVSNKELGYILANKLKRGVKARIIDSSENMADGETCLYFSVARFGRNIRCLVVS